MANISTDVCPFTLTQGGWEVKEDPKIGLIVGRSLVNGSTISSFESYAFQREYDRIHRVTSAIARLVKRYESYAGALAFVQAYTQTNPVEHRSDMDKQLLRKLNILAGKERLGLNPLATLKLN